MQLGAKHQKDWGPLDPKCLSSDHQWAQTYHILTLPSMIAQQANSDTLNFPTD